MEDEPPDTWDVLTMEVLTVEGRMNRHSRRVGFMVYEYNTANRKVMTRLCTIYTLRGHRYFLLTRAQLL